MNELDVASYPSLPLSLPPSLPPYLTGGGRKGLGRGREHVVLQVARQIV